MITRVVFNNKAFKIINSYGFKFSNNEVTFNDIVIDFTDYTLADIPYKYQEIKIMQANTEEDILNGTLLFTGYLDDIKISNMKMRKENREMTLTLLSPLKMATRRCVTLVGTYDLKTAIRRLIQPLLDDGFAIKEINVPEGQITINYVLQTVEYCMNNIGFKRNIFWYINEKKEIFINSIDYLFGLPIAKTISENERQSDNGLINIEPTIENVDYANVINFKNVRLFDSSRSSQQGIEEMDGNFGYCILNLPKTLNKGDIVEFIHPIVVNEETLRMIGQEKEENEDSPYAMPLYGLDLEIKEAGTTNQYFNIYLDSDLYQYTDYKISDNISFSNDSGDEKKVVLQRDNFYSNLITGFKWNGEDNSTIYYIKSESELRYTTMRFMYSSEINRLKGIISDSGQIEKTVDLNEKWTTLQQLISYARSLMVQNSNIVNVIKLEYDINPNLEIGNIANIQMPSFYVEGIFAVKEIQYTYVSELQQNWKVTLKSTDLISTYIDMFRPLEQETPTETIDNVILSEFIEEQVNEVHSVEIDSTEHTLNFNL